MLRAGLVPEKEVGVILNNAQLIKDRLAAADREHQKEAALRLLLRSVKYVCAAIVALFVLDVIFHLVSVWRLALSLAVILGLLCLAALAAYAAYFRRNGMERIARLLESRDPALGSRLINLLQLERQSDEASTGPLTRELARMAIDNYAAGLSDVPIEKLARTDAPRRYLAHAAWALLAFAVILAGFYRITAVETARFADPYGDHPPYSFTMLEIEQPGTTGTNVLYGSGVIVRVKASGHQPREVYLTSYPPGHPEQAVTLPMFDEGGTGYNQLLGNVRTDLVLYAHTRDHSSESRKARVGVVLTPQVQQVFVRISPPAYTGIRPGEKPYDFKGVQALEGSEVRFRVVSNRPLRDGVLELAAGDGPPQKIALQSTAEDEVSGSFIAKDSGQFRLGVVDVAGLPSQGDRESGLTVTHDLPPEVHLANPEHDSFAAMDFKLQAQIDAADDYGLREVRFHRGLNGVYSAPQVFHYDKVTLEKRETADFDFSGLGIQPGDTISFFAEAVDNAPEPHLSRSQVVRLQVISVEDYNNYLRQQTDLADTEAKYQQLQDDLQALVNRQQQLGEAAQKLQSQIAAAGAHPPAGLAEKLDQLLAQQNELNQKLNDQADRLSHFVRKDPLYDAEKELQQQLDQEAAVVRQSTQANDAASRQVAQASSPPGGPRQVTPAMLDAFKKASDAQVASLSQQHDQTGGQIARTLTDMSQMQELLKDFTMFDALYHQQQELAAQAQAYNWPGQLSRQDQLALQDIAANEEQVADTLGQLQQKLRADAAAAQKNFPKAAQSGADLANQIDAHRMEPLAGEATNSMLEGAGDESFELADRLRGEMAKLYGECHGGNCPNSGELDTYLKLLNMPPGNNFAQMSRSRKFGLGKGMSQGQGQGAGMMGTAGYVAMDGETVDVLGNEPLSSNSSQAARQSSRYGKGAALMKGAGRDLPEQPDAVKGLNPVNRQSAPDTSETLIEQYDSVVDSYFKAITTKKTNPDHDPSH